MNSPQQPEKEIQELRERLARLEASLQAAVPSDGASPGEESDERFAPPELRKVREPLLAPKEAALPATASDLPPPLPEVPPPPHAEVPPPLPQLSPAQSATTKTSWKSHGAWTAENWLARVGVTVFVVGILLFLKLALDRGWISAVVQLGLTAALSGGFLLAGWKLEKQRQSLAGLLFGIGIAGLFGTILAGRVFYGLLSPGIACVLTLLVAAVGLWQSLRREKPVLALVGVCGGYGALLYLGNPALEVVLPVFLGTVFFTLAAVLHYLRGWTVLYLVGALLQGLLLSWLAANHLHGRWALLPGLAWFGLLGWWASWRRMGTVLEGRQAETYAGLSFFGAAFPPGLAVLLASWVWTGRLGGLGSELVQNLQSGGFLIVALLLTAAGLGPLGAGRPAAWRMVQLVTGQAFLTLALLGWLGGNVLLGALTLQMLALLRLGRGKGWPGLRLGGYLLAALVFGFVVAMSAQLATGLRPAVPATLWTLLFAVVAFLLAALWAGKPRPADDRSAGKWLLPGVEPQGAYQILSFVSGMVVFWGWAAAKVWAPAEVGFLLGLWAGGFFFLTRKPQPVLRGKVAVYFAGMVLALVFALAAAHRPAEGWPFFNWRAGMVLGTLLWVSGVVRGTGEAAAVLRWSAYGIFLLWLAGQLGSLQGGVWVSPAWALCAIAWMAAGVRRGRADWRRAAILTLVLLLGRLFLVDLAALDPVWRALIFLGIGGALLLAAFYLPRWTQKAQPPPANPPENLPPPPP